MSLPSDSENLEAIHLERRAEALVPDPEVVPVPPPRPDEFPLEELILGKKAAWVLTIGFLLLLAVPPLLDGLPQRVREFALAVKGDGSRRSVAERLREYEGDLADASYTEAPREWTQQFLTSALGRGNDRVVKGTDGWWFFTPELRALTGYGPLVPEPHSVSRDPSLLDWEPPLGPILHYGSWLRELGVELWIIPVPMKPTVYPEKLTGRSAPKPVRHRDAGAFFARLESGGIRVIDLLPFLWKAKEADSREGPVYLPDDTHWSARGMAGAADFVAEEVRKQFPGSAKSERWTLLERQGGPDHGDLIEKLGLRKPADVAPPRYEKMWVVRAPEGTQVSDHGSPIVLLGDSFVNLYDDPSLGFAVGEGKSGAGFAAHLAAGLGRSVDAYAVNGEGADGVRRWLARRGQETLRKKQLVLWVLAERDLFLSRADAIQNRVRWNRISPEAEPAAPLHVGPGLSGESRAGSASPPVQRAAEPVVVEAVAVEWSERADPAKANYANALYTVKYRLERRVSGPAPAPEFEAIHWNFRDRQRQPTGQLEAGRRYRLVLEPWSDQEELQTLNLEELSGAAPLWWSATAEPLP